MPGHTGPGPEMGQLAGERISWEASVAGEVTAGAEGLEWRKRELVRGWFIQAFPSPQVSMLVKQNVQANPRSRT